MNSGAIASVLAGKIPEPTIRGGHRTGSDLQIKKSSQHKTTPHSDHSTKAGTAFEIVVGHTIRGRYPIFRNHKCACGAPVRWQPLGHLKGDLVPICTDPKCRLDPRSALTAVQQAEEEKRATEDAKAKREMDLHKWIRKIKY